MGKWVMALCWRIKQRDYSTTRGFVNSRSGTQAQYNRANSIYLLSYQLNRPGYINSRVLSGDTHRADTELIRLAYNINE